MVSRRQIVAVALLIVASFLTGYGLWRRAPGEISAGTPPPETGSSIPPAAPVAASLAEPSPARSPRRYTVRTETEAEAVSSTAPEVRSLTAAAAQDYRARARFPRSSQPIVDGIDPIARDRELTPGRSLGPHGRNPTLIAYPAKGVIEAPDPILLHAYLVDDERKVDARAIAGEVRNQEGTVLATIEFTDDGKAGDPEANDRIFSARLAPTRDTAMTFKGAQLVKVVAETMGGEERIAATGFLYTVPLAHLTGRFRDQLVDGHLQIAAEATVEASGRFHLEATLAASDGTPIAWAQNAVTLEPGSAWIPLTYWGLILREGGRDGPFTLRSVALSTTGEMPNQKNELLSAAHVTAPYRAAQFSERPYDDPELLDTAARLESEPGADLGGLEAAGR